MIKEILNKLFPCKFNRCEGQCQCGVIGTAAAILTVGAIGGGAAVYSSNAQKKAQQKSLQFAQQQSAEARAEQARLEAKYNLTPGELAAEETYFNMLTSRSGKTGEELFGEVGGTAGQQLKSAIEAESVSNEPTAMFAGELEQTRQMVNAEANRRGVFGGQPEGGVRFEQLGRAGVDLAIKSARERLSQNAAILGRKAQLSEAYNKLSTEARGELDSWLKTKEDLSARVATNAFGTATGTTNAAYGSMQDIYGLQASQAAAQQNNLTDLFANTNWSSFNQPQSQPQSQNQSWFDMNQNNQYSTPSLIGSISGGNALTYNG